MRIIKKRAFLVIHKNCIIKELNVLYLLKKKKSVAAQHAFTTELQVVYKLAASGASSASAGVGAPRDFSTACQGPRVALEDARAFCPPSCRLMKHDHDGRWRGVFNAPFRSLPGKSCGWTSKGADGEVVALRECLRECWQHYSKVTEEACPHANLL